MNLGQPTLRDPQEIQRAHDILTAVVLGEVPLVLPAKDLDLLTVALDAVCWVLNHDHNTSFSRNLAQVEAELTSLGCVVRDTGRLQVRETGGAS